MNKSEASAVRTLLEHAAGTLPSSDEDAHNLSNLDRQVARQLDLEPTLSRPWGRASDRHAAARDEEDQADAAGLTVEEYRAKVQADAAKAEAPRSDPSTVAALTGQPDPAGPAGNALRQAEADADKSNPPA